MSASNRQPHVTVTEALRINELTLRAFEFDVLDGTFAKRFRKAVDWDTFKGSLNAGITMGLQEAFDCINKHIFANRLDGVAVEWEVKQPTTGRTFRDPVSGKLKIQIHPQLSREVGYGSASDNTAACLGIMLHESIHADLDGCCDGIAWSDRTCTSTECFVEHFEQIGVTGHANAWQRVAGWVETLWNRSGICRVSLVRERSANYEFNEVSRLASSVCLYRSHAQSSSANTVTDVLLRLRRVLYHFSNAISTMASAQQHHPERRDRDIVGPTIVQTV